jgi:hypothetical protein
MDDCDPVCTIYFFTTLTVLLAFLSEIFFGAVIHSMFFLGHIVIFWDSSGFKYLCRYKKRLMFFIVDSYWPGNLVILWD